MENQEGIYKDWERASQKRQLLAIYIDFLLFEAVYQPIAWLGIASGLLEENWVKFFLFILSTTLVRIRKILSPGQRAVGIVVSKTWGKDAVPLVNSQDKRMERWWTVLMGVLLLLEGSKNLVRWTLALPVQPLLGSDSPEWLGVAFVSALGALNVFAGFLVLRANSKGALLGLAVMTTQLACLVSHRSDFSVWAEKSVLARRELQGLPVREGEIEMAQSMVSTFLPVVLALGILWALLVYRFLHSSVKSLKPQL